MRVRYLDKYERNSKLYIVATSTVFRLAKSKHILETQDTYQKIEFYTE